VQIETHVVLSVTTNHKNAFSIGTSTESRRNHKPLLYMRIDTTWISHDREQQTGYRQVSLKLERGQFSLWVKRECWDNALHIDTGYRIVISSTLLHIYVGGRTPDLKLRRRAWRRKRSGRHQLPISRIRRNTQPDSILISLDLYVYDMREFSLIVLILTGFNPSGL
jgi:hypothetical protein